MSYDAVSEADPSDFTTAEDVLQCLRCGVRGFVFTVNADGNEQTACPECGYVYTDLSS